MKCLAHSHLGGISRTARFDEGMSDEVVYIIEDTHTNYWAGGRDTQTSLAAWIDVLTNIMHYHYGKEEGNTCFLEGTPDFRSSFSVPCWTQISGAIEVVDSMVIPGKNAQKQPPISRQL